MGLFSKLFGETENAAPVVRNEISAERRQWKLEAEQERMARLAAGLEVVEYCSMDSERNGFPYACFSESEYDWVEAALKETDSEEMASRARMQAWEYARKGDSLYSYNLKHVCFWLQRLFQMAEDGNVFAKAAIGSLNFEADNMLVEAAPNAYQEKKKLYAETIKNLADTGDKDGLYAYAVYFLFAKEAQALRLELYEKAARLGSARAYEKLFLQSLNQDRDEESARRYLLEGVECEDGSKATGWLQSRLADALYYGEFGMPIDKDKAILWAKRALRNGEKVAQISLDMWEKKN